MKTVLIEKELASMLIELASRATEISGVETILRTELGAFSGSYAKLSEPSVERLLRHLIFKEEREAIVIREILHLAMGRRIQEPDYHQARFRCPDCGETWEDFQYTDGGDCCPEPWCSGGPVSPYIRRPLQHSCPFTEPESDAEFEARSLQVLADLEKREPIPSLFGRYEVSVLRTSARTATVSVDDSEGPASAQLKALEVAGDQDFGNEKHADYTTEGHTAFDRKLKVGSQYYWADPDSESESDCSGPVTVCKVEGDVAHVRRSDDTEFEVHPSELH